MYVKMNWIEMKGISKLIKNKKKETYNIPFYRKNLVLLIYVYFNVHGIQISRTTLSAHLDGKSIKKKWQVYFWMECNNVAVCGRTLKTYKIFRWQHSILKKLKCNACFYPKNYELDRWDELLNYHWILCSLKENQKQREE